MGEWRKSGEATGETRRKIKTPGRLPHGRVPRTRGVDDLTAQLAAEIAVTAFRIAVTRWLNQHGDPDLPATINQTLAAMRHLTSAPALS